MKVRIISSIALVLLLSDSILSQCLTGPQFLDSLFHIEGREDTYASKLRETQHLYTLYHQCKGAKDSVYARILHRLGNLYSNTGDEDQGIRYTRAAISVNAAPNQGTEKSFLVNSYFNLGLCYWRQGLFDEARSYFDSCIYFSKPYVAKHFISYMAFEKKAYSFFQTGDYQQAIETTDNGIQWAISDKDSLNEAILLSQKAQSQLKLDLVEEAGRNIRRAVDALEKYNKQDYLAAGFATYAQLLVKVSQPVPAIAYYKRSIQLNRANNEWQQCARDLLDLGYVFDHELHDHSRALECYMKGIDAIKQSNDVYGLSGIYNNIGVLYWRQKNYSRALYFYQKGLNVLPIHFTDTSVKSNPSESALSLATNDYYMVTLLSNKGESQLEQYKTGKSAGSLSDALSSFEAADKSVDFMRRKQPGEQSKLFWRQKTKRMYENAIETCYLLKNISKAFYFFEKSRAVLLNDKLSELGAKRYLSTRDREMEKNLRSQVAVLTQQLLLLNESTATFNPARQRLVAAQNALEKFIKGLEQAYPVYYQYKFKSAVPSLATVNSQLQSGNQSLVEYFTGDSALYMLCISGKGNKLIRTTVNDYTETAREFMQMCSNERLQNENFPRYCSLAGRLYEKLVMPLSVPEGRVIVSPDEYLIPFEALLYDAGNCSGFLLKKYAFSYTYSMGLLMKNVEMNTLAGRNFLGVAPVNYKPYLKQQSLEGSDFSLEKIQTYFPNGELLTKLDAGKGSFLKRLGQYNIVQIYSHAEADSFNQEPVLYLSDSSVNLSEIQTLEDLQISMIVLSACNTGIGKNARGEGIFSLARAFMAAGIPSTVTTLWQIDNKATYQLTESFYKYLDQGATKDVAMQKAKLEFLANNLHTTYDLPYYWASNMLLGRTDRLPEKVSGHRSIPLLIIIGGLLTLLLVAILVRIRRRNTEL